MTRWQRIDLGMSDAVVERSGDSSTYRKSVSGPDAVLSLAGERDRTTWLTGTGIPGPTVVDWSSDGTRASLVTSAVPGIPASSLPAADALRTVPSLVALVNALHTIPVRDCPFPTGLAVLVALAEQRLAAGLVDESDFDAERSGQTAALLWRQLQLRLPQAQAWEAAEATVTHGDLCLPNVLVDPDTCTATGFVDLGLLGVSDPYRDLALLDRSTRSDLNPTFGAGYSNRLLERLVPHGADPDRLAFYRLLDEFF